MRLFFVQSRVVWPSAKFSRGGGRVLAARRWLVLLVLRMMHLLHMEVITLLHVLLLLRRRMVEVVYCLRSPPAPRAWRILLHVVRRVILVRRVCCCRRYASKVMRRRLGHKKLRGAVVFVPRRRDWRNHAAFSVYATTVAKRVLGRGHLYHIVSSNCRSDLGRRCDSTSPCCHNFCGVGGIGGGASG